MHLFQNWTNMTNSIWNIGRWLYFISFPYCDRFFCLFLLIKINLNSVYNRGPAVWQRILIRMEMYLSIPKRFNRRELETHRMYQQNKSPQQQVVAPLKQQQPPLKQQQPLQMWLLRQRLPHQTPRRKLLQRTPQWNLLPRRTPRRRVLPPLPLQPQPPRHQHRCRRSPPTRWWRVVRRVS